MRAGGDSIWASFWKMSTRMGKEEMDGILRGKWDSSESIF